jgi:hypothetical protein
LLARFLVKLGFAEFLVNDRIRTTVRPPGDSINAELCYGVRAFLLECGLTPLLFGVRRLDAAFQHGGLTPVLSGRNQSTVF